MGRYEELLGKAKKILAPDEEFIESIYGSYDFDSDSIISSKWGPLIITNKRIILVKENTFDIISISFEKISQVITDKNIDGEKIIINYSNDKKITLESINRGDPKKIINYISNIIGNKKVINLKLLDDEEHKYDKTEKLFNLKQKGIISEEEFKNKKRNLLNSNENIKNESGKTNSKKNKNVDVKRDKNKTAQKKNKSTLKKLLLILAGIFLPIIGQIFVIRSNRFTKKGKIVAGLWLSLFLFSFMNAEFIDNNDQVVESDKENIQYSNEKIDVKIDMDYEISDDNQLKIIVNSNMPDQTNFLITVSNVDHDYTAQDKIKLNDGVAETSWFSSQGSGLKSGEYNVSITIPLVHTQPKSVQKVFGDKGVNLTGEYVNESSKDLGKSANKKVRIDLSLDNEDILDYEIVDINTDNLRTTQGYDYKRYNYRVVINEKAEIEELKATSKYIIEKAKKEKEFNGITLFLYDYEEFVESSYTLGRVRYVPEGKWSKANTVEPGNYEELEYNWELMKKDWSKQLTPKEAEIWKRHDNLLWTTEKSEEKIDKQVAEEFNITIKKVNEIFNKKMTWEYMDLNK